MRQYYFATAMLLLTAIPAAPALAYNKAGHKVSGAIACDVLKETSPETVEKVVSLLKQHPYYEEHWKSDLETLPAEDRDCDLFMLAAEWPDVIRSDKEFKGYNHPKWHYTDEPYKPDGQPSSVKMLPPDDENIMMAFEKNLAVVKDEKESPLERTVAICWVFHLVGDIHQPLHTTSLFTIDYPKGDQGGNLIFVKTKADGEFIKLHRFWDDLILESEAFGDARNKATALRTRPEYARTKLTEIDAETSFEQWKENSVKLAIHAVYCDGQIPGSPNRESAPMLSESYMKAAKAIADRQIVLVGYRLAELLEKSLSNFGVTTNWQGQMRQCRCLSR